MTDKIYSNYPLEDDKVKVLTFKNLDFTYRTKPAPPDDSVILFDESYLYIDGTSPHDEKKVHSGKIPWIVLARHFGHRALFTVQREGMIWNNIRQLASGIIIPISLKKPVAKKGFHFLIALKTLVSLSFGNIPKFCFIITFSSGICGSRCEQLLGPGSDELSVCFCKIEFSSCGSLIPAFLLTIDSI
ncbi:spiroplasma plectrovirus-related protein [Spiroplasma phoeniceum P40]|uniref:Spiroplasma plectrovirus-related protein n=1 Tax=Spiroplasma phoeniceum P40 TaxID=1276259 RepID=A0A345DQ93_9MOLU|nr:spiroplasma plectrovirus-related protein [Spiroplasma phoeniceum P40]